MLTDAFYAVLAARLHPGGDAPALYLAIGAGDPAWDHNPPLLTRDATRLANELARKPLASENFRFLDAGGAETDTPSTRVRLHVSFAAGEGNGTLRELGLFAGASAAADSGTLLSYLVHPPVEKTPDMNVDRALRLDLTPRRSGGVEPTRFLGNSNSREVHDLNNRSADCQVDEILFDRRIFFASAEQAGKLGYDYCAFCFGRERSKR